LNAPEGSAIVIEAENFETENSFDCLRIYNGPNNSSQLLANLTGKLPGTTTVQGGNEVFMRFTSDHSVNRPGWKLLYYITNTTDNITHTVDSGNSS